jgi:ABC-2 type transport system permease protein
MNQLLAIEWLKLKNYRTFYILTLVFIVLLPLWIYGNVEGILKIGANGLNLSGQTYSFPFIWQQVGFWTSLFVVFLSFLIIIITTNEYQFRTNRQNVIDGWTRLQFYHSKWLVVLGLSLLTTLYVFFVGLTFGATYGSIAEFPGKLEYLFYVWLLTLNYLSFSLLLSIYFRKSGITIGMFFLYIMVLESILKQVTNWATKTSAGNFFPLQASDELLPFPMFESFRMMTNGDKGPDTWTYVLVSFLWIALYYFIGRMKLLRSDW